MLNRSAGKGFAAQSAALLLDGLSGFVSSRAEPATARRSANEGICGQPSASFVRFRAPSNEEGFLRTCGISTVSVS